MLLPPLLLSTPGDEVPARVQMVARNLSYRMTTRATRFPAAAEEPHLGEVPPPVRITTSLRWYLRDLYREEATYPLVKGRVHFEQSVYRKGVLRTRTGIRDAKGKESGVDVNDMSLPKGLSLPFLGAFFSLYISSEVKPRVRGSDEIRSTGDVVQVRRRSWGGMIVREVRTGDAGVSDQESRFEITGVVRVKGAWFPKGWIIEYWKLGESGRQPITRSVVTFSGYRAGHVRNSDVAWIPLRAGNRYHGSL